MYLHAMISSQLRSRVKTWIFNKIYKKKIDQLADIPLPDNESLRLEALKGLNLIDTPPEERFDRITRTAGEIFDTAISFITLVDANRQWFKSCYGTEILDTDKKISFCAYAILQDDIFIIPDTKKDNRFKDFPVVTGRANIRFYAGVPIAAPDGSLVGTLCILDHHPRELSEKDKRILKNLAAWAELEINNKSLSQALSERKKAQKELEENNENLEKIVDERTKSLKEALQLSESLKVLRDRIIRIIAHQLRTPMSAIRWNLEVLLENKFGKFKKEQEEFIRLIYQTDVDVINRLHDLLKTLDIEQNSIVFREEEVELFPIVNSVVAMYVSRCGTKKIKLKLHKPKKDLPQVVGDAEKIRIVIERLLDNALGYTKESGNIDISFSVDADQVEVHIKDSGIGIPEQESEKIFSRFFRASNAHSMQADGSGLALYICKFYVEKMGGRIGIQSKEGVQTDAWFSLRVKKSV